MSERPVIVLVHGVPGTHRVRAGVRRHLKRGDVEAWDLPGFGAPRPDGFGSTKEEYADDLITGFEVPADLAEEMVRHVDAPMKDSILKLYRSAMRMGGEWEPELAKMTAPGLVFRGARDPACQVESADELGRAVQAEHVIKLDCNHWPPLQRPACYVNRVRRPGDHVVFDLTDVSLPGSPPPRRTPIIAPFPKMFIPFVCPWAVRYPAPPGRARRARPSARRVP
ncbi:alpha/beta fold hydrolase [Streptosporangium roseum]|uniref:alpha/beta fold hydrolase n=1 Tax=Streptosporangium roseum TaxID=2001 RepID=UPI0001A39B87|nr:hypothetical protein [Streptosporangium roseum]